MAKKPVPGKVKTRLAASHGDETAATLCAAFLDDTIAHLPRANCAHAVFFSPPSSQAYFAALDPSAKLLPQPDLPFGERLQQGFQSLFEMGMGPVVFLGCDCPHLQEDEINAAFELLEHSDLVLGPAEDGGYYLIGMNAPAPTLFHGVPWSDPETFNATRKRANELGLQTACLKPSFDVDEAHSLSKLQDLLRLDPGLCPATALQLGRLK